MSPTQMPADRRPPSTAERFARALAGPSQEFFRTEAAAGALLLVCAALALAVANSPWAHRYAALWAIPLAIDVGGHSLSLTLHGWINDGLMTLFFLLVGLEIKREILAGELASPRRAALPIAAAIGGMVVPAVLYVLSSGGGAAAAGWAVPMATDIAFALGVLALVAPHAPAGLKVFLAALAIVDDMGAVMVIALFYTQGIDLHALGIAAAIFGVLVILNRLAVRSLTAYLLPGAALWYFVHESGVHATIAGILLALTIPTRSRINAAEYSALARQLVDRFDRTQTGDLQTLTNREQQDAIIGLERASERVTAPLLRLEHGLHRVSAFLVMPLFAFSNAGVAIGQGATSQVTTAVLLGLVIGKPLGITLAAWAAVGGRLAALPEGVSWRALHGCAWLGGIGFTMSLFVSGLAFEGTPLHDASKLGILSGSLIAGVVGGLLVYTQGRASRMLSEPGLK